MCVEALLNAGKEEGRLHAKVAREVARSEVLQELAAVGSSPPAAPGSELEKVTHDSLESDSYDNI